LRARSRSDKNDMLKFFLPAWCSKHPPAFFFAGSRFNAVDDNHAAISSPVTTASNFFRDATHRLPRVAGKRPLSSKWNVALGVLRITLPIAAAPQTTSSSEFSTLSFTSLSILGRAARNVLTGVAGFGFLKKLSGGQPKVSSEGPPDSNRVALLISAAVSPSSRSDKSLTIEPSHFVCLRCKAGCVAYPTVVHST
jgi:hypothetical protein